MESMTGREGETEELPDWTADADSGVRYRRRMQWERRR